ncbi:tail terminator [Streptomyces phage Darolandstone]|uniref:Tail terminator n=1 Tax=Streptomyces phage Darolandstone TaxID=2315716 RepID=A0A386KMC4_9CAUD|nr:head-tail connector protein [Streptomyces phage Darolandstone]AYD86204.1 tail terminator [Streptomyces phage Darolandstone]
MADLDPLDGVARLLDGLGLVTYDPDGTTGDLFVEAMPPGPDAAVALWLYDGEAPDTRNAYDTPRLQVRVRGGPDPRVSRRRCWRIYSALHGLAGVALPDGTWLVLAAARATPAPMGPDSSGRHEHVVNFDLDVSAPTDNRTE